MRLNITLGLTRATEPETPKPDAVLDEDGPELLIEGVLGVNVR